jgi:hypothetical protein
MRQLAAHCSFWSGLFLLLSLLALLAGCAALGSSPEAQLARSARGIESAANLTASLYQRKKISLEQAKEFRTLLGTADSALDRASKEFFSCRAAAPQAPCATNLSADLNLVSSVLLGVEETLKAKEQ